MIYILKLRIQKQNGIPHSQQMLIFNKDVLEDERKIIDYNIEDHQRFICH